MTYRKYFKSDNGSYRQVVIEGENAKLEVYSTLTDRTTTTWNLPVTKTIFRTVSNLVKTCKKDNFILVS